jgi:hypothetical protein
MQLRIAEPEPEPRVVDVVADTAGPSSRALMIGPLPQNRAALWNRLLASTVRREYSGAWLGTPLAYEWRSKRTLAACVCGTRRPGIAPSTIHVRSCY